MLRHSIRGIYMKIYITKREKFKALVRLRDLSRRIYMSDAMSAKDFENISKIIRMRMKQL